jgi:hypothetical protein
LNKKNPENKAEEQRLDEKRTAMALQIQPRKRREGYDLEAWGWRRSLKIGATKNPEDISRCYQNIPTSMYHNNLEAARLRQIWLGPVEVQFVYPHKHVAILWGEK